jgi:hypothetical protein
LKCILKQIKKRKLFSLIKELYGVGYFFLLELRLKNKIKTENEK